MDKYQKGFEWAITHIYGILIARMTRSESKTHAGYVVVGADALLQETVPYLPGEYRWALALVDGDLIDDLGGGHSGLAAPDGPRPYRARFIVPATIIICDDNARNISSTSTAIVH